MTHAAALPLAEDPLLVDDSVPPESPVAVPELSLAVDEPSLEELVGSLAGNARYAA